MADPENGAGNAQGAAGATAAVREAPTAREDLLALTGDALASGAFPDDDEAQPPAADDEQDDQADDDAEDDELEDGDDEDGEADEEEDEESPPEAEKPARRSPEQWARVIRNEPQRMTEVPKRMRRDVQALVDEDLQYARGAVEYVLQQRAQREQQVATLDELWRAGDLAAFDAEVAKNPQAAAAFYQMQAERAAQAAQASPPDGGQAPADVTRIQTLASQQLERLRDYPEAYERVRTAAAGRRADEGEAALIWLTEQVTRELTAAERQQQRAQQRVAASERRKALPRPDAGGGRAAGTGTRTRQELLAKSSTELAEMAWSD